MRMVPNPLLRLKRNEKCLCGSGQKFKKCHAPKLPTMVTQEMADDAYKALALIKRYQDQEANR